jgi:hypothetical protein
METKGLCNMKLAVSFLAGTISLVQCSQSRRDGGTTDRAHAQVSASLRGGANAMTGGNSATGATPVTGVAPEGGIDGGLTIGGPCRRNDGHQLAPIPDPLADSGVPHTVPVPPGWLDFHQLPAGVGYCLPPGGGYPWGYFTANCVSDSDCPSDALCDGMRCRLPCASDVDCNAPSHCHPPADAGAVHVRFCQRLPHDEQNGPGPNVQTDEEQGN